MANKIFNTRVKNKRDTEANWKSKNPVLLDGEIIVVTTTSGDTRFKVGDGKKTYKQLPFQDQKTRDLIPSVDSSLSSTSTNPVQNKIIKSELDKKAERDVVNTTTNGLMSVADKKKLDGIATGANKTVVDSAISATSTNPVQNQVLKAELDGKLDKSGGTLTGNLTGKYITGTWLQATSTSNLGKAPDKISVLDDSGWLYYRTPAEIKSDIGADVVVTTSSNGLMSASDKSKLNGIASGATKTIIDSALSSTSTNPVQNKVVKAAIDGFIDTIYPLGSIYMTTSNTSPMALFPGTYWLPIYNRFLLGAGDTYKAGSTGGEATHTLTNSEMPAHAHEMYSSNGGGDGTWTPNEGTYLVDSVSTVKKTWWAQLGMNTAGGGAAHNNMPPYFAVWIWRRVTFQEYEAGL